MKKVIKYDLAIIIILSIISEADICSYFIYNKIGHILDIVIRLGFIIYLLIKMHKTHIGDLAFNKPTLKSLLILPLFVVCFSNYFVVLFDNNTIIGSYSFDIIELIKILLTALCEELTFRAVLFKEISKYNKPIKSLIISSLIFGLIHLLNINSLGSIPVCLLQSIYSFGIGLVVGFIYLYSDNFIFLFVFHFLFNFFNDTFICSIYEINYNLIFFIVNIIIALITTLYIVLLLYKEKLIFIKEDK